MILEPTDAIVGHRRTRSTSSRLLPFIGYPRTLNGLRMIDEVTLA
jgi:hypothetical protein